MTREVPSISNLGDEISSHNPRLAARYKAHEFLESGIFIFCALKKEFERNTNQKDSSKVGRGQLGSIAGFGQPLGCVEQHAWHPCAKRYIQDRDENGASDGVAKLTESTANIIDGAIKCLRLFSDKAFLADASSKGMPSWEALYSRRKKHPYENTSSSSDTMNHRAETTQCLMSFMNFVSGNLDGALPPRLVLVTAQLLQRYNDPLQASQLAQDCISSFLNIVTSTQGRARSDLATGKREGSDIGEATELETNLRETIQLAALELFRPTSSVQMYNEVPFSELIALLTLDAECVGELHGTRKTFLTSTLRYDDTDTIKSAKISLVHRKELECVFSKGTLCHLLELEDKCIAGKEYSDEWQKKRSLRHGTPEKDSKIRENHTRKANTPIVPMVSFENKLEKAATELSNSCSFNIFKKNEKPSVHSFVAGFAMHPSRCNLQFFLKRAGFIFLIMAFIAILLRLFPTSTLLLQRFFFRGSAVKQRRHLSLV